MYFELREEIFSVLDCQNFWKDLGVSIDSREEIVELAESVSKRLRITSTPDEIPGLVSTNFSFILSKQLSKSEVSPLLISKAFVNNLESSFEFEESDSAFLNFSPRPELVGRIVEKWSKGVPSEFTSIVGSNLKSYCIEANLAGQGSEAATRCFQFSKSPESLLMCLALLHDFELDEEIFLKGIRGSDNLPEYFRGFLEVYSRINTANELKATLGYSPSGSEFKNLELPILTFSLNFKESILANRPYHFLNHLRHSVRQFYSEYNHPTYRDKYSHSNGFVLARALARQVEFGLLHFSRVLIP